MIHSKIIDGFETVKNNVDEKAVKVRLISALYETRV